MSYEKVKNIAIKKRENKIYITSACSNLSPITYHRWEFCQNENMSFKEKMLWLLKGINGGGLVLNNSCYKWEYARIRTNFDIYGEYNTWALYKDLETKCTIYTLGEIKSYWEGNFAHIDKIEDDMIPVIEREDNEDYYKINEKKEDDLRKEKVFEKYYETFMKYLEEKDEEKYYLYSETYGVVKPKGTNGSFYYNTNVELMNYKKAFCLKTIIGKDIEIKRIEERNFVPTEEQIEESKTRKAILGICEGDSKELSIYYTYYTRTLKNTDIELVKALNEFENEYGAYVYDIIVTNSSFGKMYSMLYISKNKEEWQLDRKDLENGYAIAYVYNSTYKENSELGEIGIKVENNILKRIS